LAREPDRISCGFIAERATEERLSVAERLREIRTGFEPAFWVANVTELFERLSYYAAFASLANYLHETLTFPTERATSLAGWFGGLVWFLAAFGGALADRLGFRRALSLAYLILASAYFTISSLGAPWFAPVRGTVPAVVLAAFVLMLPALGIALVKPSVVGTTARASNEKVRSIGYSIYYTLVNVGSATGPLVASAVHRHLGVESVYRVAALSVLLMFFAVLIFFREPRRSDEAPTPNLRATLKNFRTVVANPKFMLFLVIFSGYWTVFWQQFITLPIFIRAYINPQANTEWVLAVDPLTVIALQLVVTHVTKRIPSFRAITLGTLISAAAWLIVAARPTVGGAVGALIVVAFGEMLQSPRYYEYISRLAPPGQQGTYMGFSFLPIGIGSFLAGWIGGRLMHHFGEVLHRPEQMWWVIAGIGGLTAFLLWIYDRVVKPGANEKS
jgi:proton-dependent oligopeptide transporter, POT family